MKWKFGWEAQLFLMGRRDRKHSAASTASFKNHLFSSCSFLANEHWQKNHCSLIHIRPILSMRPGTFHHTPRGISKPPERRVQQRGLFVSSSATAPRGVREALLPFVLLPVVTRDIPWGWHGTYPPRQGVTEMGERTDMCSSYTEQQLGKPEVMGLNTALTPRLPRSGLAFLNNWQNHGAWYYREWKFFKKSLEQNDFLLSKMYYL